MAKGKTVTPGKGRGKGAIVALLAAVAVFAVMLQLEKNLLSEYEKGTILVARTPIPKGQLITEENREQFLEKKEVDKSMIPESALTDAEQVNSLIAAISLEQGVLLSQGMFQRQQEVLEELEQPVIAAFKGDDLYQVVGGVLRGGDRIHIYSVSEAGEALLAWENLFVESVYDQNGVKIQAGDAASCAARINVYLDKADVEQFYTGLAAGALRVVKVCE